MYNLTGLQNFWFSASACTASAAVHGLLVLRGEAEYPHLAFPPDCALGTVAGAGASALAGRFCI